MERGFRTCTRCLMDTTDPEIKFDDQGVCNHCHDYDRQLRQRVRTGQAGHRRLESLVRQIKDEGRGKPYDCLVGVSGGVDSTYVAYVAKNKLGLRPLAVHMDNGWDSELAVKNIEETLKRLDIDLYTHVLNWEEFKDLQLAFLKASTPDSEIPSDHAIWAVLGDMAEKLRVRFILSGFNVRTESHLPRAWSQGHFDWKYIYSVHRQFGKGKLESFPHQDWFKYYKRLLTLQRVDILNYLGYNKNNAIDLLKSELNWKYYGGKHYESIYTRFYQGYILPSKFGYDKRRSHLSSQICSGEITRAFALEEIQRPTYPPSMQEEDREYVSKKLGVSDSEFHAIMNLPKKSYWDYPSYGRVLEGPILKSIYNGLRTGYRRMQQWQNRAQET